MNSFDWFIVVAFMLGLTVAAIYTNRYMKSVASFLTADRCAGRYLLAVAGSVSGMGTISVVAAYEMYYTTGWVVYRFRETRAMTLAQFFEVRYNRNFYM